MSQTLVGDELNNIRAKSVIQRHGGKRIRIACMLGENPANAVAGVDSNAALGPESKLDQTRTDVHGLVKSLYLNLMTSNQHENPPHSVVGQPLKGAVLRGAESKAVSVA